MLIGVIMMPGEPEQRREDERRRTGIPITGNVVADLVAEGASAGIAFPEAA